MYFKFVINLFRIRHGTKRITLYFTVNKNKATLSLQKIKYSSITIYMRFYNREVL